MLKFLPVLGFLYFAAEGLYMKFCLCYESCNSTPRVGAQEILHELLIPFCDSEQTFVAILALLAILYFAAEWMPRSFA